MSKGIPPTVGNFMLMLTSKLTQYDQQQEARAKTSKRGYHNPYALARYLEKVEKVEDELKKVIGRYRDPEVTMTEQIAGHIVDILADNFTVNHRSNEFDLTPLRTFVKQLDQFLATGKNPSLVR